MCAVRLDDGARTVFSSGGDVDPATAVAASCALPGWYQPVTVAGVRYVDGGAWSPTNADVASHRGDGGGDGGAETSVDVVVVSSPLSAAPHVAVRFLGGAMRLLHRAYLGAETAALRRAGVKVFAVEPTATDLEAMGPNPMDADRRGRAAAAARASVRRRLERGDLRRLAEELG